MSLEGAIAAHRFGLGARPGEIDAASGDPKTWLLSQVEAGADQPRALDSDPLKTGGDLLIDFLAYQRERIEAERNAKPDPDSIKAFVQGRAQIFMKEMAARFALGFSTDKPFAERLVWFWSNHFTVSTQNSRTVSFAGAYEREAIRPHINGTFKEMLLAVAQHPAMLFYLDNAQSISPDSTAGRLSGKGLNENFGRELMELYTLGVDGGYTQGDVIALAKLLTGWSIDKQGGSGFRFYPRRHEPSAVTLRGKTYGAGYDGVLAALSDLAEDKATAHHIAQKFAVYFIADDPPAASVENLEKTFHDTGGNLRALAETVVNDPAAWRSEPAKMRTPVDFITASFRLFGWPHTADAQSLIKEVKAAMAAARLMGEFPLAAPSPKGWSDTSDGWIGPDAVLNRIEWAKQVGNRIPADTSVRALADEGLGLLLRSVTRDAISSAATTGEGVALLLASPEFQRR